jgi:hypothetical protein
VPVDIFNGETLTDWYASINPMRTTPVLETLDGHLIPESNASLVSLAQGTRLLPHEPLELAEVIRWLIVEQTDVVPMIGGLRFRLLTGRLGPKDPAAMRRHQAGTEILAMLDRHLAVSEFFVGGRTRLPTSLSTAMCTSLIRPSSPSSPIASCARGWIAFGASPDTWTISGHMGATPRQERAARSTAEPRQACLWVRGG